MRRSGRPQKEHPKKNDDAEHNPEDNERVNAPGFSSVWIVVIGCEFQPLIDLIGVERSAFSHQAIIAGSVARESDHPIVGGMSSAALIFALVVTFIAAAIQGVVGLGFALVSVPILALIHPALAPVPQLLVTLPLTISMAWRERRHIDLSGVGWVIGGRVPGAIIGVAMLAIATQQALDLAIAAVVIGAVAIVSSGFRIGRTPASEFVAGLLSGISGLIASIGGPPLALPYSRDDGATVRSNLAVIFTIGLTMTIIARLLSRNISFEDVRIAAVLFPAVVGGYFASFRFKDRVSQPFVRGSILVLSLVGAAGLIVRAIV